MKIVVSRHNVIAVVQFKDLAVSLKNKNFYRDLHRGVIDAGRKTKTRVQRKVTNQMAMKPGNYQSYVVANTRGVPRQSDLSYEIFSVKKGTDIEKYKGLRAIKVGTSAFKKMNSGRGIGESGSVRSGVWNNPRIFKRSFATDDGYFAMRPASEGSRKRAPKMFWTFGLKATQPRDGRGRFASSGAVYGKIRTLFGPALRKELAKDQSLAEFYRFAPGELSRQVTKRLTKLLRY